MLTELLASTALIVPQMTMMFGVHDLDVDRFYVTVTLLGYATVSVPCPEKKAIYGQFCDLNYRARAGCDYGGNFGNRRSDRVQPGCKTSAFVVFTWCFGCRDWRSCIGYYTQRS